MLYLQRITRAKECPKREKLNALVKETEGESSQPLKAKTTSMRMNPLQLLNNMEIKVEEEPMTNEELASILKGEFD